MRKFTTLVIFVSILLGGSMLMGQYPSDEKIQPYPTPVKERTLRQRFVCDAAGGAKWKALNHSTLAPQDDSLIIRSDGHDPYVMMPPLDQARMGTFEFRIRMKNTMLPAAEIFWVTTKQPDTLAENAVRFGFVADDQWHTYTTEFTTLDPLTALRFDPGTSVGVAEIAWIELYDVVYGEAPSRPTPWVDPHWEANVKEWKTIASGNLKIKFDIQGTGAVVFLGNETIGEIYPLAYTNPTLPLGGIRRVPFYEESVAATDTAAGPLAMTLSQAAGAGSAIEFAVPSVGGTLRFELKNDELRFVLNANTEVFGPVFRPVGEMQQAVLCGVEYLEKGEHSSSTADIETKEHLRFAPNVLDVTWPFMSIVTDRAAFGLLWDDPNTQAIFAVPDIILGDSTKHHLGLHGKEFSGTLKMTPLTGHETLTDLDAQILWAFKKRGTPNVPKRLRNDEEQRLLNLAGFEKSSVVAPNGTGWMHAAIPGAEKPLFPASYGSDYVSSLWQLSGKVPNIPRLDNGGAHLQNPASFFLTGRAENFRNWKRNESRRIRENQRPDGSFPYAGEYLKGHWEDTASGHCGNSLFQLLYTYQILGEPDSLTAALKGLEFANRYTAPRGAQVWELSLHTPDIMGSSRMCMANVWAFEATGDKQYLDHARRWAITGLPFVFLWEMKPLGRNNDPVMLYATTPVFGATNWVAPNWIGLPVQWCGLDFAEACFMLSRHDQTVDWKQIGEGILVTAERMQYPDGPSVGLLPDSYTLATQTPNPSDINPTVLVMQRRMLQGRIESLDIALSADKKFRVVSPYKTKIEGNTAVIEGVAGTSYQIIVNGQDVRKIESKGIDRVELPE